MASLSPFPINISLTDFCDSNNEIPDKIYNNLWEFPLEDDCYDENRCWVKWEIS